MIKYTLNFLEYFEGKKPNAEAKNPFNRFNDLFCETMKWKVLKVKVAPEEEKSYKSWPKDYLDEALDILRIKVFH